MLRAFGLLAAVAAAAMVAAFPAGAYVDQNGAGADCNDLTVGAVYEQAGHAWECMFNPGGYDYWRQLW